MKIAEILLFIILVTVLALIIGRCCLSFQANTGGMMPSRTLVAADPVIDERFLFFFHGGGR